MTALADEQLKAIEAETQNLINERNNKQRMVEITNYEYDRYSSHRGIFKVIAFCSLFVLAGIYIGATQNSTFNWLGYPIVVTAIVVAIILTARRIWWNAWRNERNWKQFEWETPQKSHGETVWQHDKKAFEKLWSDTEYEAGQAEDWADKEYKRGKRKAEHAWKEGKKDLKKAAGGIAGKAEAAGGKGQNQNVNKSTGKREQFAPYR